MTPSDQASRLADRRDVAVSYGFRFAFRCRCSDVTAVRRLPLTLRALMLVPLLAVLADQARVTLACGRGGQSCLETAGQGSLGVAGVVVLVLCALVLAFGVARLLVREQRVLGRWLIGAAAVAAVCAGQALLAGTIGDAGALGGGWLELLAMCVAAGGVIALAFRVAPAIVQSLRPSAPRLRPVAIFAVAAPAPVARRVLAPLATAAAGRAPPLTLR